MSYMYLNNYLINMMRLQGIPCIYALTCKTSHTESRMRSATDVGYTTTLLQQINTIKYHELLCSYASNKIILSRSIDYTWHHTKHQFVKFSSLRLCEPTSVTNNSFDKLTLS